MALQFTGNRNAKMSSVVAIDWDNVVNKPGLVRYDLDQGLSVTEQEQTRNNIGLLSEQTGGFWLDNDVSPSGGGGGPLGNIVRIADRVFIGDAVRNTGFRDGENQGGAIPNTTVGASWAMRDSDLTVVSNFGWMAIVGYSVASMKPDPSARITAGVSGFVINDVSGAFAWGLYSDTVHSNGAAFTTGLEVAACNAGSNVSGNPYAHGGGSTGVWLAGGGDNLDAPIATNPNNAAIVVLKNAHTWNRGILFTKDALTGADGSTGTATAIAMGYGHTISWWASDAAAGFGSAASIRAEMTSSSAPVTQLFTNNNVSWFGAGGTVFLSARQATSGVNRVDIVSGATGTGPTISSLGSDTNIDLLLAGKGTGVPKIGSNAILHAGDIGVTVQAFDSDLSALAANSTNGIWARTGTGTGSARTITGTASEITVTNGNGVSGNPTLALHSGVYRAGGTDVAIADGGTGSSTAQGAAANLSVPYTVRSFVQATRVSTNTAGDATEAALATYTLPAGSLGPNGSVRVWAYWSATGGTASKSYRTRWNGTAGNTAAFVSGVTTAPAARLLSIVGNRNATNSQVISNPTASTGGFGLGASNSTATVDTTAAVDIVFMAAWAGATAGETIVLDGYEIEICYGA